MSTNVLLMNLLRACRLLWGVSYAFLVRFFQISLRGSNKTMAKFPYLQTCTRTHPWKIFEALRSWGVQSCWNINLKAVSKFLRFGLSLDSGYSEKIQVFIFIKLKHSEVMSVSRTSQTMSIAFSCYQRQQKQKNITLIGFFHSSVTFLFPLWGSESKIL